MIAATLTVEDFLSLGVAPQTGNLVDSHAFVPGSVLRGALAARWILERGTPDRAAPEQQAEFLELFEGTNRFGPMFQTRTVIAALSELRCKYARRPACASMVHDAAGQGHSSSGTSVAPTSCPVCASPLTHGKGQVLGARLVEATHVELSAEHETAVDGRLFSRVGFPRGAVLSGWIRGSHPWLLQQGEVRLRLGGTLSVAGSAILAVQAAPTPAPAVRSDGLVCIRLESPGIFVEDDTRARLQPREDELARLLGVTSVSIVRRWARPTLVGGWHSASRLPKPMEHAAAMGSTWLIAPSTPVNSAALARVESEGLGLRRAEGFGTVRVNPAPMAPALGAASANRSPTDEGPSPARTQPESAYDAVLRLAAASDRGYIADLLHERVLALERGRLDGGRSLMQDRRVARMPLELRSVLRQVIEGQNLEALRMLRVHLEAPR